MNQNARRNSEELFTYIWTTAQSDVIRQEGKNALVQMMKKKKKKKDKHLEFHRGNQAGCQLGQAL